MSEHTFGFVTNGYINGDIVGIYWIYDGISKTDTVHDDKGGYVR